MGSNGGHGIEHHSTWSQWDHFLFEIANRALRRMQVDSTTFENLYNVIEKHHVVDEGLKTSFAQHLLSHETEFT